MVAGCLVVVIAAESCGFVVVGRVVEKDVGVILNEFSMHSLSWRCQNLPDMQNVGFLLSNRDNRK